LRDTDFVGDAASILRGGLFATDSQPFDVAILNPPYRKIATDSRERRVLSLVGIEASNLYSAFLALSVGLLKPGGEFVAITPRSFCNGPYFKEFRASLLSQVRLQRVHSFEARNLAFSDDDVLQENVIVHAQKTRADVEKVVISTSLGPDDQLPSWHEVEPRRVADPKDPNLVIHLPADGLSDAMLDRLAHLTSSLEDLGLGVSTGPVVDFRSDEWLRETADASCVPLGSQSAYREPSGRERSLRSDQAVYFQGGATAHRSGALRPIAHPKRPSRV
jgi:adenine-specific DNA-methyltransferase